MQREGAGRPIVRMSGADLDSLVNTLEVSFVALTECLIGRGWKLVIPELELPGVHYVLKGSGRMLIDGHAPIPVSPHALVILPRRMEFGLEVANEGGRAQATRAAEAKWPVQPPGGILTKLVAGEGETEVVLVCGYFRAHYGRSIDLFADLTSPIVEQFDPADRLDDRLKDAKDELLAQTIGMGAMASALMKMVFVTLLRRTISSSSLWVERFSTLGDPNVARAFADMAARPGSLHSIQSLAKTAGLSRSIFMERFGDLFGRPPMAVLRELRMRHAAALLATDIYLVDQVARAAGYANRSSFCRAFRTAYGLHPSDYKAAGNRPT